MSIATLRLCLASRCWSFTGRQARVRQPVQSHRRAQDGRRLSVDRSRPDRVTFAVGRVARDVEQSPLEATAPATGGRPVAGLVGAPPRAVRAGGRRGGGDRGCRTGRARRRSRSSAVLGAVEPGAAPIGTPTGSGFSLVCRL